MDTWNRLMAAGKEGRDKKKDGEGLTKEHLCTTYAVGWVGLGGGGESEKKTEL